MTLTEDIDEETRHNEHVKLMVIKSAEQKQKMIKSIMKRIKSNADSLTEHAPQDKHNDFNSIKHMLYL